MTRLKLVTSMSKMTNAFHIASVVKACRGKVRFLQGTFGAAMYSSRRTFISHTFRDLTVVQRNHWAAETKGTIAIELDSQIRRIGLGVTDNLGIFCPSSSGTTKN